MSSQLSFLDPYQPSTRIKSQKCANDISQLIANKTWEFHSLLLLTPVLILTVKSTTDTSGTGTLKAIPVSLL
jgi:hypothetical protein